MTSPWLGPNSATLGPLTFGQADSNGTLWTFESLQGWGSPAPTLQVTQFPRDNGGWPSESFLTARTIVIGGTIASDDPPTLAAAKTALITAASLSPTPFTVSQLGYPTLTCTVQRSDEVLFGDEAENWTTFSVQMIAPDPKKYGPTVTATTGLPVQSGGLSWPLRWPAAWSGNVTTGQVNINNPGNITAPVLLTINGPCAGPIITHVASGVQLVFSSSLTLAAGEFLTVDMQARTALANGQSRRDGYITSRGWFGLDPGLNEIAFQAQTYNSAALLTVQAPEGAWM